MGLTAVILLSSAPTPAKIVVTGIGMVGGALATALGARMRAVQAARDHARPSARRRQRAWNLFALGSAIAAFSNLLLVLSPALGTEFARAANVVLWLALLTVGSGMVTFPLAQRRTTDLGRMALDGVVVAGSALFVLSVIVFPRLLTQADEIQGFRVSLAIAVADIVIGTVTALLFLRAAPQDRPPLGLSTVALFCFAASDFAYALGSLEPVQSLGTITDFGWILGYALFAVAVHSPGTEATPHGEQPVERTPVLGTLVMFCLFLGATVFRLVQPDQDGSDWSPTATGLAVAVLLAVMARQVLLVIDNGRLRRDLEQRVEERTRSLRQATQQSRLVVTSVGDGIYGVDADGMVTFVNPAALAVLGYAETDLIGREAHAMFHAKRQDGSPFPVESCYVTEAITEHKVTSAEDDSYRRADGRLVPVEVTATPLVDDGRAIGAVMVFRDVTQRREVDRMKSEFVSIVSHELRTPVTAIHGALGLLAGGAVGPLNPSAQRMVDIALISSDRLGRLINDILDVERIESGMMSMELDLHDCRPLIESAVSQVQVLAEEAGVRVSIGAAEGQVFADGDRVVQTLLNLLGNAIKFSHPGGYVSVRSEAKGEFVEFAIRDDGRGIPKEKLNEIFSRFNQVDSSDAREKGGFGLGLSISRSIVERLGGEIWAQNNVEAGATFRFTLPAHRAANGAANGAMYAAGEPEGGSATAASTSEKVSEPAESRF